MLDLSTTINRKGLAKTRIISFAVVFCLVFTTVMMFNLSEAKAAPKQSLKITSNSWSKKSVDVTLSGAKQIKVKLNVKVKNTYKTSNKLKITIQNTKTKKKLDAYTNYKGGKAEFSFTNAKKDVGTWKLISVTAVRQETKKGNLVPGYFSHGIYYPSRYQMYIVDKKLKTVKASKKAKTLKVTCGTRTKLTLSAPKTIYVSDTKISLSATLKTEKGKAVKGETVHFENIYSYQVNGKYVRAKKSAKTNSKGVATVTIDNIKQNQLNFDVQAYYNGKAKKYCTSSAKNIVERVKENTRFEIAPKWDGSTGMKTFQTKIVVDGGRNNGKPVGGLAVGWYFYDANNNNKEVPNMQFPGIDVKEQISNAQGIATLKADVKEWTDYKLHVTSFTLNNDSFYNAPKSKDYNLKKVQKTVYYTLDPSKLSLTGLDYYLTTDWFNITAAASKANMRIFGTNGVFVDANGKQLDPARTFVGKPINGKAPTYTVELLNSSNSRVGSLKTGGLNFSDNNVEYSSALPDVNDVIATDINNLDSAERAATQVKVTINLGEFGSKNGAAEFRYVPISGKSTITKTFSK